ncbi:MAG: GNAT family N-acetyltransferase [Thermoguttaceae bacterium]
MTAQSITFRTFRNTDPPQLAAIWRSQEGQPNLAQPVSPDLLEQYLFAKLYFDYHGLIVACEDDRLIGFAHAGFGPNEEENGISTELGMTYLLLVRPNGPSLDLAAGLLQRSEAYLREKNAKILYGGGIRPLSAFYFGLYGGSELPGVLETDTLAQQVYPACGYQEIERTLLFRRDLTTFETPMERRQMQIRRQMIVEMTVDPPSRTWWEACVTGEFCLTRFDAVPRGGGAPVASVTFREMELAPGSCPSRSVGLVDLVVEESFRRRGVAIFLLSEAFRQFIRQGATVVQAQAMQHNIAALGMFRKLGFQQESQGSVFRKEIE